MAIRSLKTGSMSRSALAGNPIIMPGSYESIASFTVGAGGASSVDFTSIPQTYSHLQVRFFIRSSSASNDFSMGANGGFSITNSSSHALVGTGSSASAGNWVSQGFVSLTNPVNLISALPSGSIGVGVIDILDYTNTNKTKVIKALWGSDQNGSGFAAFNSGSLNTTSAITAFNLFNGYTWGQYSQFSLYGVN